MYVLGLFSIPDILVLIGVLLTAYYMFLIKKHGVFKAMGVPGPAPLPFFGPDERYRYLRETYGKVCGIFMGRSPFLVLGDIDLAQQVANDEAEPSVPPLSRLLVFLRDDDWKLVRTIVSPTFTTARIKQMAGAINTTSQSLVSCMQPNAEAKGSVNLREMTSSYTMDTIASVAFGVDVNCQSNPNDKFVKEARLLHHGDPKKWFYPARSILMVFLFLAPVVKKLVVLAGRDEHVCFFEQTIADTISLRQSLPEKPVDFLQFLIDAEGNDNNGDNVDGDDIAEDFVTVAKPSPSKSVKTRKKLTRDEILAQCILFFLAGHDTTSTSLTFTLHYLARNPDMQQRVVDEINSQIEKDADPDYDSVGKLEYMEMVIMETLRLNPVAPVVNRECSRDVRIGSYFIRKGTYVTIPIWQIHHDPEIWENPEIFDPERFHADVRAKHHRAQWMPFGIGPRQCIGMRLAMLELKIVLVHLLRKYKFTPSDRTQMPIKFAPFEFLFVLKTPIYVQVENRME